MSRRFPSIASLALVLLFAEACTNKSIIDPLANLGSKQPDKVLFERATEQMKQNRFDQARITLQALINSYPDSEYIMRAKLTVADSWYAEGGTTSLDQAELEYKYFLTFFSNMPEAAEAQLKIASIHYQQMEKPDRDFTHAMRAEEEHRRLILEFPDSKLIPQAKQRLLEVQEVLAQHEFKIGRYYFLHSSYPAAVARLQSVVERYPLFSGADKALYLLGRSYEGQITNIRASKMSEAAKATLIQELTKNAASAFSNILTRYPLMGRAADAKDRLLAIHQPVPTPTKEAIAQNQKEEDSRRSSGRFRHLVDNFSRRPELAQATKVGEPTLADPKLVSASQVLAAANHALVGGAARAAGNKVSLEIVKNGTPPPNELASRSDTAAPNTRSTNGNAPASTTPASADIEALLASNDSTPTVPANARIRDYNQGIDEITPNVAADAQTPPPQVNEMQGVLQQQGDFSNSANSFSTSIAGTDQNAAKDNSQRVSSSKDNKKKHKRFF